jgi:predicted amidohydrolase YtcJ
LQWLIAMLDVCALVAGFAYRTLSEAGTLMGFSSDWPVVEVNPMESVFASVTRAAPAVDGSIGSDPWAIEEQLDLQLTLLAHTYAAAQTARLDHLVGVLKPGMVADFVVWDRSPFGRQSGPQQGAQGLATRGFEAGMPRLKKTYMDGLCVYGCDDNDS